MILQGNCLEVLKTLEPESVNMCITSPPYYGLRDYGTAVWSGGDENCDHKQPYHRGKTAQVGNQLNEADAKQYEEVCEKCGAVKQEDNQIGLEQTPTEYINKLCDVFDEVKRVLRNDGSCWINLGDSYSGSGGAGGDWNSGSRATQPKWKQPKQSIPPKCLIGIPAMFQLEMVRRGWILRNVIIWHKPACMPSSVRDRYTIDFEHLFFFVKQQKYYFKQQLEPFAESTLKGKPTRERKEGSAFVDGTPGRSKQSGGKYCMPNPNGRNKRCVWSINPASFKEAHFAVYPEKLIESPIDAGCPVGGVVLDCFFGAGTTGVVAKKQKKDYIGIELNPEYIEIAQKRIDKIQEELF
jgi:DNA modification methylase